MTQNTKTAYITKHWQSKGILRVPADKWSRTSPSSEFVRFDSPRLIGLFRICTDVFLTEQHAVEKVERLRALAAFAAEKKALKLKTLDVKSLIKDIKYQ